MVLLLILPVMLVALSILEEDQGEFLDPSYHRDSAARRVRKSSARQIAGKRSKLT